MFNALYYRMARTCTLSGLGFEEIDHTSGYILKNPRCAHIIFGRFDRNRSRRALMTAPSTATGLPATYDNLCRLLDK